jgi:ribosome-associated translation inhibitor RaiA
MAEDSDKQELGGNIELSGFKDIEPASMIVIKKIVGNYAKKFSDQNEKFEKLSLNMKKVHKTPKSEKYEIHCNLMINGKSNVSEVTERNLFVGLDDVLKKVSNEIKK